ncbi:hypothetical protein AN963_13830 [Brevibacillus choshinensis]|uniref:Carbohydrate-binding/sugar hydrolysis domain-containing protein n=1 Tax=Brevibacillus choshinensis TaxID=54911 RepID=A0ABR5N610_BRECH|nr:right-handed parallel beta-helix repeat-containing protein [Brevibacillus choshinensis]KQL46073.1 hypothetical protein AN963_13830 [Brevibacillus choshinensis]
MSVIRVPRDQPTIQDGVNAAGGGDVVLVADGIYHEDVVLAEKLNIRVIADGDNVVLDGGGILAIAFTLQVSLGIEIKGFTIQNYVNVGIFLDDSSENNLIRNSIKNVGANGIELGGSVGVLVWQNKIENASGSGIKVFGKSSFLVENHILNAGNHGIETASTSSLLVAENSIEGAVGNGLQISSSSNNFIVKNRIQKSQGNGISLDAFSGVISDNHVKKNQQNGIFVDVNSEANSIEENVIEENNQNGIEINGNNNAFIRNRVDNNAIFDIVDNGTNNRFVDNQCMTSSPASICLEKVIGVIRVPVDQPSIQAAVDVAQAGDVILVADGVYHEAVEVFTPFIRIISEGSNAVLDGKGIRSNAFFLKFAPNIDFVSGIEIKGFTIKNYVNDGIFVQFGSGNSFIRNKIKNVEGNGIEFLNAGNIGANLIWQNTINESASGIRMEESFVLSSILENKITSVRNHGIDLNTTSNHLIWKNKVEHAGGAGIRAFTSSPTGILKNDVQNNKSNGIHLEGTLFARATTGNLVANNISKSNKGKGIFIDKSVVSIIEENNVEENKRNGIEFNIQGTSLIRNRIKNNTPFDMVDSNNHYVDNQCMASNPAGICVQKILSVIQVPRDQPTIQQAVQVAQAGDVILVSDGVYHETVEVNTDFIRIIAKDDNVILDGEGKRANAFFLFPSAIPNAISGVEIKGFKIKNYCNDGILVVNGIVNSLINNRINEVSGNGIELLTTNGSLVWRSKVEESGIDGIRDFGSENYIIENHVRKNKEEGISIEGMNSLDNVITDNDIEKNDGSGILINANSTFNVIQENKIKENDNGIEINGNQNAIIRNRLKQNRRTDIKDNGAGNHYVKNRCMNSDPSSICSQKIIRVIRVPGDQPTIQKAVNVAQEGDVILVADGVYHEAIEINTNFIRIVAEGDHAVLDGEGALSNAFSLEARGVEIKGFTIRNYVNDGFLLIFAEAIILIRNHIKNVGGNGIKLSDFNTVCLIRQNKIEEAGGSGIQMDSLSSQNYILQNDIRNNQGSGITALGFGGDVIAKNVITENKRSGIFVGAGTDFTVIQENTLKENKENGIELHGSNHAIIRNKLKNNTPFDIDDLSNNFVENSCATSNPQGICGRN